MNLSCWIIIVRCRVFVVTSYYEIDASYNRQPLKLCTIETKLKQNSFETVLFQPNSLETFKPITAGIRCLFKSAVCDAVDQTLVNKHRNMVIICFTIFFVKVTSYRRSYLRQDVTRYFRSYSKK